MKKLTDSYTHVSFAGEDLSGYDLSEGEFVDVNFSRANLTGSIFKGCKVLINVNFFGAILCGANLENVAFTGTVVFEYADLCGANLRGATINGQEISSCISSAQMNC